ncbi:hypothetical protein [Mucilaginibacter pedocola]|uniref:Uncharacterized protein n=1 Tax=Mucilaginibacter pedocola TaxID=1792845 RepID=A0A1S9PGH3_9SPHI|nr:hypothetical protein [Mucilaginibacter pedocola]OOQ60042.1 hypothetical protein BC343_27325 [Mucilaginibacter pedocola]
MKLSKNNAIALLVDIHQNTEEYAEATVKTILEDKDYDGLIYPPNTGFTDDEKAELNKLRNNEHLKSALGKILADNSANVVFSLFNIIDGTTDPKALSEQWSGVKLVDNDAEDGAEPFGDMLHDGFLETYWAWQGIKEQEN